jgi:hypothetical protein
MLLSATNTHTCIRIIILNYDEEIIDRRPPRIGKMISQRTMNLHLPQWDRQKSNIMDRLSAYKLNTPL